MRTFLTATAMLSVFAAAGAQVINPTDTNKDQVNRGTTTANL